MKLFDRTTTAMTYAAGLCLLGIVAVTIFDAVSNNIFRRPIRGTFEIVELLLATVVFFGLPDLFRHQLNIVVDVIDHFVSARTRDRLLLTGSLATLAFLLLVGYAMIGPALDTVQFPEYRQDTGIRTTVFWIPILIGTGLCNVAAALDAIERLRRPAGEPS